MSSTVSDVGQMFGADVYGNEGSGGYQYTYSPYATITSPTMTASQIDSSALAEQERQQGLLQQQQLASGYNSAIQSTSGLSPALAATLMGNNMANSQQTMAANTANQIAQTNYGAQQYNASALNSAAANNLSAKLSTNQLNSNNYNTAHGASIQGTTANQQLSTSMSQSLIGGLSGMGAAFLLSSDHGKKASTLEGSGEEGVGDQTPGQNSTDMFLGSDAIAKHLSLMTPVSYQYKPGEITSVDPYGQPTQVSDTNDPDRLGVIAENVMSSPFSKSLVKTGPDGKPMIDTAQMTLANAASTGYLDQKTNRHEDILKELINDYEKRTGKPIRTENDAEDVSSDIGKLDSDIAKEGISELSEDTKVNSDLTKSMLEQQYQTTQENRAIREGFQKDYANLQTMYPALTPEDIESKYSDTKKFEVSAGKMLAAFSEGFTGRENPALRMYNQSLQNMIESNQKQFDRGLERLKLKYGDDLQGQQEKLSFINDSYNANQHQMQIAHSNAQQMLQLADTPSKVAQAKINLFTTLRPFQLEEQKLSLERSKTQQALKNQVNSLLTDPGTFKVAIPEPIMNDKKQIVGYGPGKPVLLHINNKDAQDRINRASASLPYQLKQIDMAQKELSAAGSGYLSPSSINPNVKTQVASIVSTLPDDLQKQLAPQLTDYMNGKWDNPDKTIKLLESLKQTLTQNLRNDIQQNGFVIPGYSDSPGG